MNDWRIHRREGCCSQCGRAFGDGEAFYSLLHLDDEFLKREDRCPACFVDPGSADPSMADPAAGGAARPELLFWRAHHSLDKKARFAVDFEAIEELFLALEGRREGRQPELRYLLALLLLRKKRLKLVGVRRHPSGEVLCVRRPRRQEEFEVQVFELDSERAQALRAELARVFEGAGVEALATPEAPAGSPPGGTPVGEAAAPETLP